MVLSDITAVTDKVKKMSKKKLIIIVIGIGAISYFILSTQKSLIPNSVVTVANGYVNNQPHDLCVDAVNVDHQIFPPKFGMQVHYKPCARTIQSMKES